MKYEITYELDHSLNSKIYLDCKDVGMAFARCQQDFPKAKMIRGRAYGTFPSVAETLYDPPPIQRDYKRNPHYPRPLKQNERGCEFPFYDEVVTKGRS